MVKEFVIAKYEEVDNFQKITKKNTGEGKQLSNQERSKAKIRKSRKGKMVINY